MRVPAEAWEGEFPIIDMCLKDSIRLQMSGAAFRQNVSGKDIPLNKAASEVIPRDSYVTLSAGDSHYNPAIFENPDEWDPSRYMPDRAEDKKSVHGFFGWGVARHPCLGMRFAKLEVNVIVAFFLAYFEDIEVTDKNGKTTTKLPAVNRNKHTASRPDERIYLKYSQKSDKAAA
jgi:sterol 14-demethylase